MTLASDSDPKARRFPLGFVLAVAAYFVTRGLVLHTSFDQVGLWMYEVFPMGTLAELAIRGIHVPPYFFYDNAAGQVLAGYLAVPAFLLLGPSYLALKIVPLLMGLGALLCVHALLRDAFGRTAGLLGAWLFVFAPTTLFKYSVVCSGNHFENVFFTSVVLYLFYRLHRGEITLPKLFLLGASAGFSIFVFLGAVIPVGILAGLHVGIRGPRRGLRDLAGLIPGFFVGLAPLLVLNAWTGGRGAFFLAAKFGEADAVGASSLTRVPSRIASYLAVKLPQAAAYPAFAGVSGTVLSAVFAVALVVATLACVVPAIRGLRGLFAGDERSRFEGAKLVPMIAYLPLSALAFGLSNLVVYELDGPLSFSAFRYYLPVLLFGILALAAVCARGFERGGRARAGAAVLFAAALLPGLSNLGIVDWTWANTGHGLRYDGYDLSKVGRTLLAKKNHLTQAQITGFLEGFPPLLRARVTRSLGFNLAVRQVNQEGERGPAAIRAARIDLDPLLAPYDVADRAEIARGAGIAARFLQFSSRAELSDLLGLLARSSEQPSASAQPCLQAFLQGAATPNPSLPLVTSTAGILAENGALAARGLEAGRPRELAQGIARGDGFLCGGLLRRGIASDARSVAAALRNLPAEVRPSFFRGLGAGCAEGREEPGLPEGFAIPPEGRAEFWRGFAETLRDIHGEGAQRVASRVAAGWSFEDRADLERAIAGG
jgi:hypothetical protein